MNNILIDNVKGFTNQSNKGENFNNLISQDNLQKMAKQYYSSIIQKEPTQIKENILLLDQIEVNNRNQQQEIQQLREQVKIRDKIIAEKDSIIANKDLIIARIQDENIKKIKNIEDTIKEKIKELQINQDKISFVDNIKIKKYIDNLERKNEYMLSRISNMEKELEENRQLIIEMDKNKSDDEPTINFIPKFLLDKLSSSSFGSEGSSCKRIMGSKKGSKK